MARILEVDDDSAMAAYYSALFGEAGHDVRTAPDVPSGMDLYYDFHPELLVLDAEMPGGGGGTCLQYRSRTSRRRGSGDLCYRPAGAGYGLCAYQGESPGF